MNATQKSFPLGINLPQQAAGQVVSILPTGDVIVEYQQRGWQCRVAISCLLSPQTGDEVLICGDDNHRLWVLAVLSRSDEQQTVTLSVPGNLCIAPQGELTLHSAEQVSIDSQSVQITAQQSDCHIAHMRYSGDELTAWVNVVCLLGQRVEALWKTVVQISQRVLRKVEQAEHVRVGQLDCQARDYVRLHARNTIITSQAITKVDSEQIHMG
ncbi:DUF3540 domain-containing protein [Photorhabdus heterorhabditis]|uniref:DUF3540 domain-containing protein n=1 Tax=Photorhabdus heterorhabditis TaxID=880156 RepID=A0ABR5K9D6_9GAMM|nr:DUF3540 domain-containing protein [Photorhabdus heterorhabditis]KOY61029.1 hypothetical protein AM629_16045 [Photorhabdus heterorhabditis]MBS9443888.1 DUF3540 domain-containing protein [Photorhabdus heterorhabditis]